MSGLSRPPKPRGAPGKSNMGEASHTSTQELGHIEEDTITGDESSASPEAAESRATVAEALTKQADSRYGPLPWSNYFDEERDVEIAGTTDMFHVYSAGKEGPVLLCLHGGGYTGVSFATAAAHMKATCRVIAPDLRGHGRTRTSDDADLSAETLCEDTVRIFTTMFGDKKEDQPPVVLIGHSMGGAIAARTAALRKLPTLAALVVIDVVEGTAMSSLAFMQGVLAQRPSSFPSLDEAIRWAHRTSAVRNEESARVSVPSQMVRKENPERYEWRAQLKESEPHWAGWYQGLSDVFLAVPVPKLLLLAGTDRMDKPLTIGQMQGKFQMTIFKTAGHAIHEDEPEQFSETVLGFVSRHRIGQGALEISALKWGSKTLHR
ncbi:alpha/beta hydrolase superfamily [Klebsormidium nitens]|uniref:Protein phosphatase methylesterase 1 n=1 Tax=Klebsormidium nitens TaxID=105231 RepID=A0A1Y1IFT6_KLENI|nr:alpha/beta hydrolase superfamily [Klebsormidium nitens]|eukprot:GAQ88359.1 alpha/beta hydrolase superfamily [Klebsormidium nitens]